MIAILSKDGPADQTLARAMLAAAPHRGATFALRVRGSCVLGVATRDDFIDASVSADGPIIAALLGRLDNAAELEQALRAAGAPAGSSDHADLVAAAVGLWGLDAPSRMRGSFAGLVSDGTTVWGFRDHLGFRPLFYADGPRRFVAAAESRQVVVGAGLSEEPDLDLLTEMLFGNMPADAPAALRGVCRLAQATALKVGRTGPVSRLKYWHPIRLLESARLSPTDVPDRFYELMQQATARTLSGHDVILLSGGLDSPAVASFAAPEHQRRYGKPLGALSCVFPDLPAVDERPFIEAVATCFGMPLDTYRPAARTLDDVDRWCRLFGSPIPIVSVPELADSHARTRRLGYRTVLTGDFAEFSFGNPMHLVSHLLTHGRWRALAWLLLGERQRGASLWRLTQEILTTFVPGRLATWYQHLRGLDFPERIPSWLDAKRVSTFRGDLLPPSWERWRRAQHSGLAGSTITIEADEVVAASAGITIRRPFADVELWEFFLSLPAEVKCPDLRFKSLVRGMMRGRLPDVILDRRKKTVFDDHVMKQVDYPALRRLLVAPRHRIPGVDYDLLAQGLERADFTRFDWFWAKDLAVIHAFLNAW